MVVVNVAPPRVGGLAFFKTASLINDFGSHKGCHYMIRGHVFVHGCVLVHGYVLVCGCVL
jgi:hypothetical protein